MGGLGLIKDEILYFIFLFATHKDRVDCADKSSIVLSPVCRHAALNYFNFII